MSHQPWYRVYVTMGNGASLCDMRVPLSALANAYCVATTLAMTQLKDQVPINEDVRVVVQRIA